MDKHGRAENGDIWKAICPVIAAHGKGRRQVIEANELVEFRYWNPANIRTRDGLYLKIEELEFKRQFEFVGRILRDVYERNSNTTAEILDARLYEAIYSPDKTVREE